MLILEPCIHRLIRAKSSHFLFSERSNASHLSPCFGRYLVRVTWKSLTLQNHSWCMCCSLNIMLFLLLHYVLHTWNNNLSWLSYTWLSGRIYFKTYNKSSFWSFSTGLLIIWRNWPVVSFFCFSPLATNTVYPSGCPAAQWLVLVVRIKALW